MYADILWLSASADFTIARTAGWMLAQDPGVHIPGHILQRLDGSADAKREGASIGVELIRALRGMETIAGVHVMAHRNENLIPEILRQSGLTDERAAAPARQGPA